MRQRVFTVFSPMLFAASALAAQSSSGEHPIVLESSAAHVVIIDPVSAPSVADDKLMERLVDGCRRRVPIESADSARLVNTSASYGLLASPDDAWTIVIASIPHFVRPLACGAADLQRAIAAARGVSFTHDSTRQSLHIPIRVAVVRDGAPLPGQRLGGGPTLRVTPFGVRADPDGYARVAFDIAMIAPSARGLPTDLKLAFGNVDGGVDTSETFSPALLRELWDRAMPTRFRRAHSQAQLNDATPISLPVPRDPALAEAHRLHTVGDHLASAEAALARFRLAADARLDRDDILSSRLQLGFTALAMGDSSVAIVNFEQAKIAEPCVRLAEGAPEEVRQMLDRVAYPRRACALSSFPQAMLRGLLLPGFGHRRSERSRLIGAAWTLAIGGVLLLALQHDARATEQYDAYLAVDPGRSDQAAGAARAVRLYERAELTRVAAGRLMQLSALAWGAAAVDGVLSERRFRARLEAVGHYGEAPRRLGLSVGVF